MLLTTDQVASYFRLSKQTIYLYIKKGELNSIKIKGKFYFKRADITDFIESQKRQGKQQQSSLVIKEDNR